MAKPNFGHCTAYDENLVAVHMKKTELVFNEPVYLGMSIQDLSKTLMYDFHYNYMKVKYGDNCTLLMTDTDSLMYEVKTEVFTKTSEKMFGKDLTPRLFHKTILQEF